MEIISEFLFLISIIEGPPSLQNTIDHLMTIQQDMRTSMWLIRIVWNQIIQGLIVVIAGAETSHFDAFNLLRPRILRRALLKQEGLWLRKNSSS